MGPSTRTSFFSWWINQVIPQFAKHRKESLVAAWRFLNVAGLLRTLFVPYRRLSVGKDAPEFGVSSLFDQLVFNTISRLIGASVRLSLILVGLLLFVPIIIVNFAYATIYIAIPLFALPSYLHVKSNTFFSSDFKNPQNFAEKLTGTSLFKLLKQFFDENFQGIFQDLQSARLPKTQSLNTPEVLTTLYTSFPRLKSYLDQNNIKQKAYETVIYTLQGYLEFKPKVPVTPLGQILAFGYTQTLEKFASAITGLNFFLTESEKQAIENIEKVLTRTQNNNVLLVGETGVGRHATVENLATAIATSHLPSLSSKQLLYLDTIALAGTGKNLVEVKSNFESVLAEAKNAGNIILVIDQIDRILSSRDGRIDLSEVLSLALRENLLPIIGISTWDDFSAYLRPNSQVLKFFEKIELPEPKAEDTLAILIGKSLSSLKSERVSGQLNALIEIIERSNQLISDRRQPEKSILLLSDAIAEAKVRKLSVVDLGLVDAIISQKTKTPVGKITEPEAQKLKNLETILHKRIIGQEEAITEIARAMRRARAEIETGNRPIGSFLFLGPTGVGKTETAKALAKVYFGSEDAMVRLDMSEYQSEDSLNRLIGNLDAKTPGHLASLIRDNPFGLLLIDEFEKANPSVHNLFLQILDEGFMTDAFGKKVSFDNVIIIATSNAGAEFIREELSRGASATGGLGKKLIDYVLSKNLFTPELINRFDGVVVYHPLTPEEVVQVAALMLKNLAKKIKETKNITLDISPDLAKKVAETGFDPAFGARPIRRLIADRLEDGIAKMIIDGNAKNGTIIPAATLVKFLS